MSSAADRARAKRARQRLERDRQRLHRERARAGRRIVPIEITPDREELLLAAGLLREWDAQDRVAIAAAVERLLDLVYQDAIRHA